MRQARIYDCGMALGLTFSPGAAGELVGDSSGLGCSWELMSWQLKRWVERKSDHGDGSLQDGHLRHILSIG